MKTLLVASMLAVCAWAQTASEPPLILQLVRKPGIAGAVIRQYANAGAAVNVLGMVAVTGVPETWLVEVHPSFGSIEDLDRGLSALPPVGNSDTDLLAPARTMIALYRPGWSYRSADAIRMLGRARYFELTVYSIRAGTEADFGELVRLRRTGADSINLDRPDLAFRVVSGAPGRMFVFLAPLTSLRTIDEGMMQLPTRAESAGRAAQGEIGRASCRERV
jgi:hypothetical protein